MFKQKHLITKIAKFAKKKFLSYLFIVFLKTRCHWNMEVKREATRKFLSLFYFTSHLSEERRYLIGHVDPIRTNMRVALSTQVGPTVLAG